MTSLAELPDITIPKPCIPARKSVYQAAVEKQDDDDETYFHANYFFPTIDNVVCDI